MGERYEDMNCVSENVEKGRRKERERERGGQLLHLLFLFFLYKKREKRMF